MMYLSVALQAIATAFAVVQVRLDQRRIWWLLVALVILFLPVRELAGLIASVATVSLQAPVVSEPLALMIAFILFAGVLFAGRYFHDIGHARALEHESEERYRTLAESSPDFIFIIGRDMRVQYVNHRGMEAMHLSSSGIVGNGLTNLFSEKTAERQSRHIREVFERGLSVSHEGWIDMPGKAICLDTRLVPLRHGGAVIAVMGISRDITSRKEGEATLRESELRYRTLFEASSDAIFLETLDGRVLDCNGAATHLYGYSKEELQRMTVGDLVPAEIAEHLSEIIEEHNRQGRVFLEAKGVRRDGTVFPTEVNTRLLSIDDEKIVLVYVRDITERMEARRQLEAYSKDLERMVESRTKELDRIRAELFSASKIAAMGRMSVGIAHQLISPISGGLLLVDTMADALQQQPKTLKQLMDIQRTFIDMRDVIQSMLSLAMSGTRDERKREPVQINDVLAHIVDLANLECHNRDITVRILLDENLPPLSAVRGELDQVFLNLINNAIDVMDAGGALGVESRLKGGTILVRVQDTGGGILPEDLDKIFEPFFTTRSDGRGLGLGLYIAQQIVERYHGKMQVDSDVGRGTLFEVALPLDAKGDPS